MDEFIELIKSLQSPITFQEALVAIGFSMVFAVIAYLMYQFFYGSRHIGAGVHRTFLIGGPAITALFLGIMTSIPLGLGLLGALSFVRFRTPVKDPAEIGFLLLLIMSSIGAATNNYILTTLVFGIVAAVLGIKRLTQDRFALFGQGYLMISLDQAFFPDLEPKLTAFLKERLSSLRLETMSVLENRVSLNYQYRRRTGFDWAAFTNELTELTGPAKVEIFVG